MSFLIVDDSAYMRTILRTILAGFGCRTIYEAEDGVTGLEKLNDYRPDLAIIDWEMPVMTGLEMVKSIRNPETCRYAFMPLILLTAHTERRRILQARRSGVNEVLRKPISPNALFQRVASIVLHPRPFIRTSRYFGPEPREEIQIEGARLPQPVLKSTGGDMINIDDFDSTPQPPRNKNSAA